MNKYDFLEKNILTLEDSFSFSCIGCGGCCKNRDDILLSAYDIFRLSKGLNMPVEQVVQLYCEIYVGSTSNIPIVRVRFIDGTCCFFKNNRCAIHVFKPSVCKLYPLGRGMEGESGKVFYFNQDVPCGMKSTQLVKEWIKGLDEEIFIAWSTFLFKLMKDTNYNFLVEKFTSADEKLYRVFFYTIFDILYLHYDTSIDFLPQLKEHFEMVFSMLHFSEIENLISKF